MIEPSKEQIAEEWTRIALQGCAAWLSSRGYVLPTDAQIERIYERVHALLLEKIEANEPVAGAADFARQIVEIACGSAIRILGLPPQSPPALH